MKTSDADLIDVLRSADPASGLTLSASDATEAVHRAHPERMRRRRWSVWAVALTAIFAVGVPAGAVASGFAARTGWFGSPNPVDVASADSEDSVNTESDGTEWLDLGAADLSEVVASLYPEWLPLAPGITREELVNRVIEQMAGTEGLAQETYVRKAFEYAAYRDWIGAWITASNEGDTAAQAAAAAVLVDAAGWPATVSTDGGGITDGMRAFAARIAGGDVEAAQALAQVEHVPGWDGTDRSRLIAEIIGDTTGQQ